MSGGGPYRDTVRPQIADARRRLEALREQQSKLRMEHYEARAEIDRLAAKFRADRRRKNFKAGLVLGAIFGLLPPWPVTLG